jgi:hypothetical protein
MTRTLAGKVGAISAMLWPKVRRSRWIPLLVLVATTVGSRLPQVRSPNLLLDGDECTLGLMAKHVAEGRAFPLFFAGQHYGFSAVETTLAAAAFNVFGAGPIVLKLSMLGLWSLGAIFLALALEAAVGRARAVAIVVLLALSPAWAVWSMKARGGYVTAFTATAVLLWIVGRVDARRQWRSWLAAGALTAVIYAAQPLWLPGALVFASTGLVLSRRWSNALVYAAAALALALLLRTSGGPALWNPNLWASAPGVLSKLRVNLTGAYYLSMELPAPGPVTAGLGWFWLAAVGFALVVQVYRLATHRRCLLSHALAAALLVTLLVEWVVLGVRDARYMLPVSEFLIPLVGLELVAPAAVTRRARVAAGAAVLGLIIAGACSAREFARFSYLWTNAPGSLSESARLHQVATYLDERGVTDVFAMNGLLEWQLMFYSHETIVARFFPDKDRYPPYVDAVNAALADGRPVAVVGYADKSGAPGCWDVPICSGGIAALVPNPENIFVVDGKYFVYVGATRALLQRLHFQLKD